MKPIASMTGAGFAAGPSEIGEVRVELRSVNGRGLNLKLRLSSACSGHEAAIEERIKARLVRGSVTVVVERVGGSLDDCNYMCACYPGGGKAFKRHFDTYGGAGPKHMRWTSLYYPTSNWSSNDGGQLRLSGRLCDGCFTSVARGLHGVAHDPTKQLATVGGESEPFEPRAAGRFVTTEAFLHHISSLLVARAVGWARAGAGIAREPEFRRGNR